MLYEHYLIKLYDSPVRGPGKLKDWLNRSVGREMCQEEQGDRRGAERLGG